MLKSVMQQTFIFSKSIINIQLCGFQQSVSVVDEIIAANNNSIHS